MNSLSCISLLVHVQLFILNTNDCIFAATYGYYLLVMFPFDLFAITTTSQEVRLINYLCAKRVGLLTYNNCWPHYTVSVCADLIKSSSKFKTASSFGVLRLAYSSTKVSCQRYHDSSDWCKVRCYYRCNSIFTYRYIKEFCINIKHYSINNADASNMLSSILNRLVKSNQTILYSWLRHQCILLYTCY